MKDITFSTFTVARYIDPWTSWVPACSQTRVFFIVGLLFSLNPLTSVSLIHTLSHGLLRAMDFVNLAKFHSKLALSFHPKLLVIQLWLKGKFIPFLCGNPSTFSHIVTWSYRTQPLVNGLALAMYVYGAIWLMCEVILDLNPRTTSHV